MMRRSIAVLFCLCAMAPIFAHPEELSAQAWNDERSRALVQQATERRARQIADTALSSYKAGAHGYLTFLAQVGEGFTEPPKIVKADELALEVYWKAPNLSKQLIAGRRDTLLLPTDINYHRDHLGIVQNNFPNIIRLGDGDEVRDVPHPLSSAGLEEYDYAIRDSLQIRLGPRTLDVYEVRVRPKNERQPRAVGAVYIDKESGEVVRMAFSFTRAALKDKELEDVSVVLENGLIEGRFWLPRRQEIEIRRTGTWLDYPARGIIRGRWEICCYEVNREIPAAIFSGPEIALAPAGTQSPFPFSGNVLDSLPPDVRAVTDADVAKVQDEARALVRAQSLARTRNTALSARGVSDFIRVNRVEGLAIGGGITRRLGEGFAITGRGRYGIDDERLKGKAELSYRTARGASFSIAAYDDYDDVGDVRETSLAVSSLSAQEFGTDLTDLFGARGFSASVRSAPFRNWSVTIDGAVENQRALQINSTPFHGSYTPTVAATTLKERRLVLSLDQPTRLGLFGFETRFHLDGAIVGYRESIEETKNLSRFFAQGSFERPIGRLRIAARSQVGWLAGGDSIPAQHLMFVGGPTSAPGYRFHQFAARAAASQKVELQFPVPFPSFSLGRYGRTPASITLAPFANAAWIDRPVSVRGGDTERRSWHPSIGVGALTLFDLVRVDLARGLRDGRWIISADVSRDLWSIL